MAKDAVSSTDHVEAGLSTQVVPPAHPCPVCGKAMKDISTKEEQDAGMQIRRCSHTLCLTNGERTRADWTSGQPVLITAPNPDAN